MNFVCKEVWVRFKNPSVQGQRLTAAECSGATSLFIHNDANFIYIEFESVNDEPIKVICFSLQEVREVACERDLEIV